MRRSLWGRRRDRHRGAATSAPIISLPYPEGEPPASLRVLAVTNMWPHAARPSHGVFTERQMTSMTRHGVAVDVLAIVGREDALASLGAYMRAAVEILKLNWGRRKYDLIHAHTGHCGVLACLQVRYPVVMSYVGYDLDTPAEHREGMRTRFERAVFRNLSRWFAATIAKSRRGANQLPFAGRARNTVLPNGVDRDLFAPADRAEARASLGWPEDDAPVALFLADPTRYTKRFPLAEEALERAKQQSPTLRLEVCDDAPAAAVPIVMNACDLLILTSVAEGSPNVVKEALACDLPVVSVDVGDVREHLTGVLNSHVCDADADVLATAIVSVVRAMPQRSDGRKRTEHLGIEPIARELRVVYERAAERGPGLFGRFSRGRRGGVPRDRAERTSDAASSRREPRSFR